MENYLVNPSGRAGHWYELDLLQEHMNFWIKVLKNAKSTGFDSTFLREAVCLNIPGFQKMYERITKLFGIGPVRGNHAPKDKSADINKLGFHLREARVLEFLPGRQQPYRVVNDFEAGYNKLFGGQLQLFLDRTSRSLAMMFPPADTSEGSNPQESLSASDASLPEPIHDYAEPQQLPEEADETYSERDELDAPPNPICIVGGVQSFSSLML